MIENQVKLLKYSTMLWNEVYRNYPYHANLHGANLNSANLNGANLCSADLHGANLICADLRSTDLRGADLYGANLRGANLFCADLHGANLHGTDLQGANLNGANLSSAKNLISQIDWIEKNLEKMDEGFIAYKSFQEHYQNNWPEIKPGIILSENVNFDRTNLCACGINVGTKDWCKNNCENKVWKCLIKFEWLAGVCVPYNTDGKFRCEKLEIIEEEKIEKETNK